MTVFAALRKAAGETYRCSWRLLIVNSALSAVAIAAGLALPTVPLALLVAPLAAGPFAAALVHCAVRLAREDDLSLADGVEGLRLYWRRGLALGGLFGVCLMLGAVALGFYGRHAWPLAIPALYAVCAASLLLLTAWPLAVAGPEATVGEALRTAGLLLVRKPGRTLGLGVAVLVVNALGALVILPLLTLTIAFSFVVTAHVVLGEEAPPWPT